jgi:aryl-alcohol dehydrogenase-like predicted oxidoreductase
VEILPLAESEKVGVISYSPLGGGLLTGKYGAGHTAVQGRLVEQKMYKLRYGDSQYYEIAQRFSEYARVRGLDPASLAVAWIMSHPAVTAPIIGARNVEQLEPSLAALQIQMTPEWREEISELSITPPPATDRREESLK